MADIVRTFLLSTLLASGFPSAVQASDNDPDTVGACGWYAIVGCARDWNGASSIAPPGTLIVDTNFYPNFSNGWFCAADGPYATQADVPLWRWKQFRSDAYSKNAC